MPETWCRKDLRESFEGGALGVASVCRWAFFQRLRSVVGATSMHGHAYAAVISLAPIALATLPLMAVQLTSRAPGRAEVARATAVSSGELLLTTQTRPQTATIGPLEAAARKSSCRLTRPVKSSQAHALVRQARRAEGPRRLPGHTPFRGPNQPDWPTYPLLRMRAHCDDG
jgi:hypothetical protein